MPLNNFFLVIHMMQQVFKNHDDKTYLLGVPVDWSKSTADPPLA